MFVTQQIVPRCKEWLPLATSQLRLRSLIQILAFSIRRDAQGPDSSKGLKGSDDNNPKSESYYYTLHSTTMSAPFYTSEKVCSDSPKWKEIEFNSFVGNVSNSTDAFVIRLWSTTNDSLKETSDDQVIAVWGVYLSGLTYIGPNLGADTPLKSNSIVFLMPGGYFTDVRCLESKPKIRYISVTVSQSYIQPSYNVNTLTRLHTIQQVIKKELAEVNILKQKISMGDFFRSETRGRTMLRRLLSKNKPRISHQEYIRAKENIEIAKYRVRVLKEEKSVLSSRLKDLKTQIETLSDENQIMESKIMENYRLLMRKVQVQRELKRDHISRRECQLHSKAKLNFRAKQLISELNLIYPIVEESPEKFSICGVHLPNSEDFAGHDDVQISVALGFVTHVIQMISVFLQVPLRYPVIHFGSRSRIIDHITDNIPDSEREFPLYQRGKEKAHFHYAVYLLNKNIAQLRWLCGLPTLDLRNTLSNLSSLVKMKSENSNLDHSNRSVSSSTADVCSSCVSISSPVGSILSLSNKKPIKSYRISETGAEDGTGENTPPSKRISGHKISASAGSEKDLMISAYTPVDDANCETKKSQSGGEGSISNSFTYSLDKDLNHEGSKPEPHTINHVEPDAYQRSLESRDVFLESWNATQLCSDEDSYVNDFRKKDKIEIKVTSDDINVPKPDKIVDVEENELEMAEEVVDEEVITKTVQEDLKCDNNVLNKEQKNCDDENSLIVSDNLLESVTSRTEALANQTTSFNMFRSRFNSTVENSS
ncbi:UNVERIFIED_CONTAM: hypothetical protein PYX00_006719 [Menopon gallinae]|uniref:UV radiation resistance-associated gene protein n=1 Tax=Menopon gallinae TaxID=328185 RepID=A0AAW2HXY6_9NEOP